GARAPAYRAEAANSATTMERLGGSQGLEGRGIAIHVGRIDVADVPGGDRQETRGHDVAVGRDEHDPVAIPDPGADGNAVTAGGARAVGGGPRLEQHAAIVGCLGGGHRERPRGGVPGDPAQRGLALVRRQGTECPAAADRYQEEETPARGAEAGDELARILQVGLRLGADERVDLQWDPGAHDPLRGDEGPAKAAEDAADGVVARRAR